MLFVSVVLPTLLSLAFGTLHATLSSASLTTDSPLADNNLQAYCLSLVLNAREMFRSDFYAQGILMSLSDLDLSTKPAYVADGFDALGSRHRDWFQYTSESMFSLHAECFEAAKSQLIRFERDLSRQAGQARLLSNRKRIGDLLVTVHEGVNLGELQHIRRGNLQLDRLIENADIYWIISILTAGTREDRQYLVDHYPKRPSHHYANLEKYQLIQILADGLLYVNSPIRENSEVAHDLHQLLLAYGETLDVIRAPERLINGFLTDLSVDTLIHSGSPQGTPAGRAALAWKLMVERHRAVRNP